MRHRTRGSLIASRLRGGGPRPHRDALSSHCVLPDSLPHLGTCAWANLDAIFVRQHQAPVTLRIDKKAETSEYKAHRAIAAHCTCTPR